MYLGGRYGGIKQGGLLGILLLSSKAVLGFRVRANWVHLEFRAGLQGFWLSGF